MFTVYSLGSSSVNEKLPSLPVTVECPPGRRVTFTVDTGSPVVRSDTLPAMLPLAVSSLKSVEQLQ